MSNAGTNVRVLRVRELTLEMLAVAERGELECALELHAKRELLLHEFLDHAQALSDAERNILTEVTRLDDRAIGSIEHLKGGLLRNIEILDRGKRALRAYGDVQSRR